MGALVDMEGALVDFMLGALVESFVARALGDLVFLDILGPLLAFMVGALVDFGALVLPWAKAVAQRRAKKRKRVLMEFILMSFVL